uniref:Charged multivesicular body protein 5 n=1 Tax=Ditylenchus dipsaci TaxID=166011 RepID=A0A915DFI0_9BILA
MQDEMEEMLDMNSEIQDALSGHYEMPDIDENELKAELDALGDEIALDTDTSYLDKALQAPSVPTSREPSVAATTSVREHNSAELDYLGLPKVPAF